MFIYRVYLNTPQHYFLLRYIIPSYLCFISQNLRSPGGWGKSSSFLPIISKTCSMDVRYRNLMSSGSANPYMPCIYVLCNLYMSCHIYQTFGYDFRIGDRRGVLNRCEFDTELRHFFTRHIHWINMDFLNSAP